MTSAGWPRNPTLPFNVRRSRLEEHRREHQVETFAHRERELDLFGCHDEVHHGICELTDEVTSLAPWAARLSQSHIIYVIREGDGRAPADKV